MTDTSMVFGRELRLPCNLLFGATSHKMQHTTDYAADLTDVGQHLKVASDRTKAHYDRLADSAGFHEDGVWFYRPTQTKGKSPKMQPPREDPY